MFVEIKVLSCVSECRSREDSKEEHYQVASDAMLESVILYLFINII